MDGRKSKKQKRAGQGRAVPSLSCIEPHAAGIDVGATEIFVAVPQDRDPNPVRSFETFTEDLHRMKEWLLQCRITTVATSSFGYSPHRDRSGTAPPRHHCLNHQAWNRAQERAQQHHCCVGLFPATMTNTSITADRPVPQHPYSSLVHFSLNPRKRVQRSG
jgi:hypothetical protein